MGGSAASPSGGVYSCCLHDFVYLFLSTYTEAYDLLTSDRPAAQLLIGTHSLMANQEPLKLLSE